MKRTKKISSLVKEAVGFNGDRGDSIVVTSGEFIEEIDLISTKWYEESWFQKFDWPSVNSSYFGYHYFWCLKTIIK